MKFPRTPNLAALGGETLYGSTHALRNANPHPTGWPNERRSVEGVMVAHNLSSEDWDKSPKSVQSALQSGSKVTRFSRSGGRSSSDLKKEMIDTQGNHNISDEDWDMTPENSKKALAATSPDAKIKNSTTPDEFDKIINSHFGHAGIPGHRGGSLPGKGGLAPDYRLGRKSYSMHAKVGGTESLRKQYAGRPEAYKENVGVGSRVKTQEGWTGTVKRIVPYTQSPMFKDVHSSVAHVSIDKNPKHGTASGKTIPYDPAALRLSNSGQSIFNAAIPKIQAEPENESAGEGRTNIEKEADKQAGLTKSKKPTTATVKNSAATSIFTAAVSKLKPRYDQSDLAGGDDSVQKGFKTSEAAAVAFNQGTVGQPTPNSPSAGK